MKCNRCRGPAVIEVRRHNAAYCKECFIYVFHEQVKRAIRQHDMFAAGDRILLAISGGKDSLALWDVLLDLDYDVTGLYLGLGIGGYSDRSGDVTKAFAAERGAELIVVDLERDYGFDIPTAGRKGSRSTCAVCGLSKRYVFNRAALEGGFDVIATGHNLDDEAATLLGNTLRWQTEYIARQTPALPGKEGMVKKVKPLFRLSELETAAYAFLRGIDYVVEECPLVAGNTQLRYKDAMNAIESTSPGTKAQFFLGYLERGRPLFTASDDAELSACERCGQPTTGRFCAFCRARAQILGERLGPPAEDRPMEHRDVVPELADEVMPAEIYGGSFVSVFEAGERVMLVDQRDRTYLMTLQTGGTYHTHSGTLPHDDLLGKPEGTRVETSKGMVMTAFRPRFADFVLKMPRGAQVVYPKDLGPIMMYADIYPGSRVLEAGTGSGALTIALCRSTGADGRVVSYDLRADHRDQAIENVEAFFGKFPDQLELRDGDIEDVSRTDDRFDRCVLDLPEPWRPLGALHQVMELGGVLCAYMPTTVQVQELVLALQGNGFQHVETFETLRRSWHVTERSVRPDHRMVGHTGFLTIARHVGGDR